MSTVHLAFDERLERYVAVKLLAEHLASDPAFVSRFQREALAAARLIHPNIVQVFDSGLDEHRDQHYIVMEYIDGQSCAEILRDRGWLTVEETLPIVLGACAGLDYAHRKGVVHRDVKPGNLLLGVDRAVKLADFGIAKATEQSSITQIGSVLGHRRLPRARAGPRRGGGAAGRHLRARRRHLPAALGPAAVRGRVADGARDQAAARAAGETRRARRRGQPGARRRRGRRAADRPAPALPDRGRDGRARSRRARAASHRARARRSSPPRRPAAADPRDRARRSHPTFRRAGSVTPRQPRQGQPRREVLPEPEPSPVRGRRIAAAVAAVVLIAVIAVVVALVAAVQRQRPAPAWLLVEAVPERAAAADDLIDNNTS